MIQQNHIHTHKASVLTLNSNPNPDPYPQKVQKPWFQNISGTIALCTRLVERSADCQMIPTSQV